MTLDKLQEILGERVRITNDMEMEETERKAENEKSEMIARLAKQMINNADVILRADKLLAEGRITAGSSIARIVGHEG